MYSVFIMRIGRIPGDRLLLKNDPNFYCCLEIFSIFLIYYTSYHFISDDPLCPVRSFELYLQKRNKSNDAFFQKPKKCLPAAAESEHPWYMNQPKGKITLGSMMVKLSSNAGLSKLYTN